MGVNAYINFPGNCREAVTFYADVFETPLQMITTFGEVDHGFPMPEETKNLVMHTELNIMGSPVMFSDVPGDMPFTVGNNISLTVTSDNADALKAAFHKLKVGGQVIRDLQQTFWSELYGFLIDKYGVCWQVSHETAKQAEARAANPDAKG